MPRQSACQATFDAWLIWNIWKLANPTLAEAVPVAERWRVYRDAGVALTMKGREREHAGQFVAFLESCEGARIFAKRGWKTERGRARGAVRRADAQSARAIRSPAGT
ncbi:MAG TPA: substrate-binding domain-containing protein [Gemmatimonadaceae bacterium]|nr:substrate-binding domain-containing protein [Gemmatimonadaceae bacterium]